MASVGSWSLRKKNHQDPLSNPVWFFKGTKRDNEKLLSLNHLEKEIKSKADQHQKVFELGLPPKPNTAVKQVLSKDKKFPRVSYVNNWETQIKKFDPKTNSKKDDF